MIRPISVSFGRAVWSQLHIRMLLLTFVPFILSLILWGVLLWLGLQPLVDLLQDLFTSYNLFAWSSPMLATIGAASLKAVIVPLVAMWLLLPLMILTALLFIGLLAMPVIQRHVASRWYPDLELRKGGTLLGSLWTSLSGFSLFLVLWILSLPLAAVPPFGFIVQPLIWGWLTCRVMGYDALSAHADEAERKILLRRHRWPLLLIGIITGALGVAPTALWLGGVFIFALLPFLAAFSIWLYLLVFVFTGLWFQHYCLAALQELRDRG